MIWSPDQGEIISILNVGMLNNRKTQEEVNGGQPGQPSGFYHTMGHA